jgi:GDP-L-galactose phosphorylase
VCQPFDPAKFNFTKASVDEVMLAFEPASTAAAGSRFSPAGRVADSPNAVLINVSPIDYGHALLCPRVLDCLPQQLDRGSVLLALRYAREVGNPYLRVGYNSLGAYATINHLHFQVRSWGWGWGWGRAAGGWPVAARGPPTTSLPRLAHSTPHGPPPHTPPQPPQAYYLNTPMPIERPPTAPLAGIRRRPDGVRVSRLVNYPVNAFVLEQGGGSLDALADAVAAAALALQAINQPFNLLISDCGGRVFVVPQCYAEKQAKGVVPEHLLATGEAAAGGCRHRRTAAAPRGPGSSPFSLRPVGCANARPRLTPPHAPLPPCPPPARRQPRGVGDHGPHGVVPPRRLRVLQPGPGLGAAGRDLH